MQESVPDLNSSHLGFATGASILGLLVDFNFLHHFLEEGAIMGPVVAHDSDLLGVFSHVATNWVRTQRGLKLVFYSTVKIYPQRKIC